MFTHVIVISNLYNVDAQFTKGVKEACFVIEETLSKFSKTC